MELTKFFSKLKRKAQAEFVQFTRPYWFYPILYLCWWHRNHAPNGDSNPIQYLTAVPNQGAGIGHQMANWIAGYWFAKQFNLQFAHIPFSTEEWETFLGFGESEATATELLEKNGYKKITLPLFDEYNQNEIALIRKIISSYCGEKVIFFLEQDQAYHDQYGVAQEIHHKFHNCSKRKDDRVSFSCSDFNIAVHVRRGDIVAGLKNKNPNLLMRLQSADYFCKVLANTLTNIKTTKPIKIHIISQGDEKEFSDFEKFGEIHYCTTMGPVESFLHMVKADLLITSKSSFSYKPALLSHGIRICPRDFWHGYPIAPEWILAEEDGSFDPEKLKAISC